MPRAGHSGRPRLSRPLSRRRAFLWETLESRQLLSTVAAATTIKPNLQVLTAGPSSATSGVSAAVTNPTPYPNALTPALVDVAYNINRSWTSGKGETIAIVDAYNDPNIASDLAVFDAMYKLPAASLTVENQYGQTYNLPATDPNWSMEIALDVEWAHVAAPGARIILVEANSASIDDLMAAVQTAARQANVVSMSWGGGEFSGESQFDSSAFFGNPRVTFVAASGDDGAASGAEWPAVSPNVVSVGGTSLTLNSAWGIASQTAWSASGSYWNGFSGSAGGTSLYESEPSYQTSTIGNTDMRATPDVASIGDPNTGLSVYNSVPGAGATGWFQIGGTSAGAPLWAGIIADADQARAAVGKAPLSSTQTLNLLYGLYKSGSYYSDYYDVVSGQNLAGNAGWGYDLVTGLGSPYASKIVAASAVYTVTSTSLKRTAATTVTHSTTTTAHVVSATVAAATADVTGASIAATPVPQGTAVVATQPSAPLATQVASQTAQSMPAASIGLERVFQPLLPSTQPFASSIGMANVESAAIENESVSVDGAVQAVAHHSDDQTVAPVPLATLWDFAIQEQVAPVPDTYLPEQPEPPALGDEVVLSRDVPDPLFLISGSVGLWGTWMYGSRRIVEKRRRLMSVEFGSAAR